MYGTPTAYTILLLLLGSTQPLSVFLVKDGPPQSIAPAVLIEQLKPNNEPSPDIPLISIADLLAKPESYHEQHIVVRGTVRRLELHVDESTLFIDYVFWLKDGEHQVLVFGQHDRTTGDIQMVTDRVVEVRGLFWQERFVDGYRLKNNLEAQQVRFYPPVHADRA